MVETPILSYIRGLGRRKRAIAQVRLVSGGTGIITVNDRSIEDYFSVEEMRNSILVPLRDTGLLNTFDITVKVLGGGIRGQADAVRLGVARAIVEFNPETRAVLKKNGFLKRDARKKERKKFGLKKARRAPQWSKR